MLTITTFLTIFSVSVQAQSEWYTGRATFYGNEYWLWDIHKGSCGYYYLCPEEGTGWDIVALPDAHWGYQNSCSRCYEVKCNPSTFSDNYGEYLDRSYQCYDPEASVVVTVTDTCPCNYPNNAYSNQRWCCGDMDHLDLSVWSFEKLAEQRWGVIGLQYREVPCDYVPWKAAPEPENPFPPTPVPEGTSCPKGNFPLRPNWQQIQQEYRRRIAEVGAGSFVNPPAVTEQQRPSPLPSPLPLLSPPSPPPPQSYQTSYYFPTIPAQQYPMEPSTPTQYDSQQDTDNMVDNDNMLIIEDDQVSYGVSEPIVYDLYEIFDMPPIKIPDPYPQAKIVYDNQFQNGWNSFDSMTTGQGRNGEAAFCGTLQPSASITIQGGSGLFSDSMSMELWIESTGSIFILPNLDINIGGPEGFCDPVNLHTLYSSGQDQGYTRFDIFLGLFDQERTNSLSVFAFASRFYGCGSIEASTIDTITISNNKNYNQELCIDEMKVLG